MVRHRGAQRHRERRHDLRYSLNEFFTEWGLTTDQGESQDLPLGKAILAGTYAEPLAAASDELLCPDVERAGDLMDHAHGTCRPVGPFT